MKLFIAVALSIAFGWAMTPVTPVHINNSDSRQNVKAVQAELPRKEVTLAKEQEKALTEPQAIPKPETPEPPQAEPATIPPATDHEAEAKAFIYHKESGNDPLATNSIGCFGIGQDCNGIVQNQCGGDYACQDDYFTSYMLRRYGSWSAAKQFWLARTPINGRDVGNWW